MTINVTQSGGTTTITLTYSAPNAKAQNYLLHLAHAQWDKKDMGTDAQFDALTNAQKLQLVDAQILELSIGSAKADYIDSINIRADREFRTVDQKREADIEAARVAANSEIEIALK